ncbi:PspC domain-containing protein [Agromyces sp. PvR057]|uniref:PspC domain-containing protein n=1 Tax=Agromyces sp. PvR057 TaxID=3156403 RepID=UPI0033987925
METNQTAPQTDPVPEGVQGDSAQVGPSVDGAVGSAPSGAPDATGPGFYAWLRRLGLPRRAGWLGGVCAGIGARLGIDPIIVRGIVVVVAVLGAPFVLLYAIAWLLLPDTDGEIHLERLTRGIVDPAIVGIAVMGVLGFIPFVQGGWLGWQWWDEWPYLADPIFGFNLAVPLRILWTLLLVGGLVTLVIWLARRASQNPPAGGGGARTASAADAARSGSTPAASAASAAPAGATYAAPVPPANGDTRSPGADAASAQVTDAASAAPSDPATVSATEPPVPAMGADAAAIAEWREQHEAWRVAHREWTTGQEEAARAARAQAAAENREKARQLAASADAARAERRASRPRASAAFVFTVLGVSLIGGAIVALWALGDPEVAAYAVPVALAAGTLVLALGMIIAALRRRRSGGLAFLTLTAAIAMLIGVGSATFATQGRLIGPDESIGLTTSQRLVQPIGNAYMRALPVPGSPAVVQLTQGIGDTWLGIDNGAVVLLDASDAGPIDLTVYDDDGGASVLQVDGLDRGALVLGGETGARALKPGEQVDAVLDLTQRTGAVHVQIME